MDIIKLKEKLNNYSGGFFSVKNYKNQNGEISNYLLNVKVNIDTLKKKDVEKLNSFVPENDLQAKAKEELLNSLTNPSDATKNRSEGQKNAYVYVSDGIKLHTETMKLFFVGQRVKKTIVVNGVYPAVNSRPLTIEKNKIKKTLSSPNYRQFQIGTIGEIKDIVLSPDKKTMEFVL